MSTQFRVPIGYRFLPTDEELIFLYLPMKVSHPCQTLSWNPIAECNDFYSIEPWRLPGANNIKEKDDLLFFYVLTEQKSKNCSRFVRKAGNGTWKATCGDHNIFDGNGSLKGYTKALTYMVYPCDKMKQSSKFGKKTNWIMHEYRLFTTSSQSQEEPFQHWTICKISCSGRNANVPSEIVDSNKDEIAQLNYYSAVDEQFERWSQETHGGISEQRMSQSQGVDEFEQWSQETRGKNREQRSFTETEGAKPQQSENTIETNQEFGPSMLDHVPMPDFSNMDFSQDLVGDFFHDIDDNH